jgi:hypothetical protein
MTNSQIKQEKSIDIASDFISYQDIDVVATYVFNNIPEETYRETNFKKIGDLIEAMNSDDCSSTENLYNSLSHLIAVHLQNLNDIDFTNFAIDYYDDNFSFQEVA